MSRGPVSFAAGGKTLLTLSLLLGWALAARAELPSPRLDTVFPAGGKAGDSVEVVVSGTSLDGLTALRFNDPRIVATTAAEGRFTVAIGADVPPGTYDVRALGSYGASAPRSFDVGDRMEQREIEPNDRFDCAQQVPLDVVVNGRIEKPGDVDCYTFAATSGRRIVLECRAERLDSQLRAVVEVYDAQGKRLAGNRGYAKTDPLVDFRVPADGTYVVKVFDLTFAGGQAHIYRLEIDTGPRVEFSHPCVLQSGRSARVAVFGRNLSGGSTSSGQATCSGPNSADAFDRVDVEIMPPERPSRTGLRLDAAQWSVDAFAYHYPGGNAPLPLTITDVPVVLDAPDNHSSERAQAISPPCEVSGQLASGDEQDWFAIEARRGDVFWLECFGERIGSPVDLDLVVLEAAGRRELAHLTDFLENVGGYRFPTCHLDPAGKWVAGADGRYLFMLRNLTGGVSHDPRRVYRLSIRREEPDFDLAAVSRRADQPAGLNVWRGGRELVEVLALRRRGLTGPIRVTAENLPAGFDCPAIWIGPGVDRAPLVISCEQQAPAFVGSLRLTGHAESAGVEIDRAVEGGAMIWAGRPTTSGRLTADVVLATAPEAPLLVTASPQEAVVYQDSVFDLAVDVERRIEGHTAPVNLSGVGLPERVEEEIAALGAGKNQQWISFYLPAWLAPGPYTLAVRADTDVPLPPGLPGANDRLLSVTSFSNPITIHVEPARVELAVDPRAPKKIARGQVVQLGFTARRKHGFIGKVHVELAAPGGVAGLRARGVTLVGQADSGSLQVIATDNAPLGRQACLRLEAVGTVEDRPVYRAGRFVELEITP